MSVEEPGRRGWPTPPAGSDAAVVQFLAVLEDLAAELGEDTVLDICRRFLADPQVGFAAALRQALGEAEK